MLGQATNLYLPLREEVKILENTDLIKIVDLQFTSVSTSNLQAKLLSFPS
jgi:hypothetical protein